MRIDLNTWLTFLSQTAGKPFKFIFPQSEECCDIMYTDASGSVGFGGVIGCLWFQGVWEDRWWRQQNIALLELIPIYIGIVLCHHKLSDKTLALFTDNQALVAMIMIRSFFSRDKATNNLLKALALFTMRRNIVIKTSHVAGKNNIIADKLSRGIPGLQFLGDKYTQLQIPSSHINDIKSIILG